MKCKVINSSKTKLEEDVNTWLSTGKYEITQILQTESGQNGYMTVTIFYLDLKEIRKKKIEKLDNLQK